MAAALLAAVSVVGLEALLADALAVQLAVMLRVHGHEDHHHDRRRRPVSLHAPFNRFSFRFGLSIPEVARSPPNA